MRIGRQPDVLTPQATFGNAVEMVITVPLLTEHSAQTEALLETLQVQTLRGGLYAVVKATLLGAARSAHEPSRPGLGPVCSAIFCGRGSVLSNVLLVLGMSFLFGGLASRSL